MSLYELFLCFVFLLHFFTFKTSLWDIIYMRVGLGFLYLVFSFEICGVVGDGLA